RNRILEGDAGQRLVVGKQCVSRGVAEGPGFALKRDLPRHGCTSGLTSGRAGRLRRLLLPPVPPGVNRAPGGGHPLLSQGPIPRCTLAGVGLSSARVGSGDSAPHKVLATSSPSHYETGGRKLRN